ncbi:zinc-dependent alcohol dehydrogenase family protein [Acidihalobacter prosperus]|uniref:Alcohol dehydrogenase n=1 Tax=Acidihalobacter prosperus TaxID=160660 RepID=A0A1A6C3L1_9GAMM|nr:zinc-dependent alcohol dehydrogenase family protein [Acidihalobacter prosperus]OBS09151.1 alcohol dehydrogenase [Acidihalobacter prosperus]
MKAIQMTAAGGPEVLRPVDMAAPTIAGPGQVRVHVRAAGVNPIDTKIRSRGPFFPDALPIILGLDGAGVVAEVGEAVTGLAPGDEVWYCNGGLGREPGNYAEYTVIDAAVARRKPAGVDFAEAAAGPLVLLTAWEGLFDRAGLQGGQTVLVHAGAGGVGHVAIQLAKWAGARVATTVGTPEKAALVREFGADHVIDYRREDFVAATLAWTGGRGVDVCLDTVGGETFARSVAATAHYGSLITLLEPDTGTAWGEARTRNLKIGFELMLTPLLRALPEARAHQGDILDRCAKLIQRGSLRVHVSRRYPLDEAAAAHAEIERGRVTGKLVLLP